jgi:hypothetical protein
MTVIVRGLVNSCLTIQDVTDARTQVPTGGSVKRVYKFLPARWALRNLSYRYIKCSEIADLNDPFELIPFNMTDSSLRTGMLRTRDEIAKGRGLLCMCQEWRNPLLWAHYADKHRGICLGFDSQFEFFPVTYTAERPHMPMPPTYAAAEYLSAAKYIDWAYEKEVRAWINLEERQGEHFFYKLNDHFKLAEVIAGALCPVTERKLRALVSPDVIVRKARLASDNFDVVEDESGFGSTR